MNTAIESLRRAGYTITVTTAPYKGPGSRSHFKGRFSYSGTISPAIDWNDRYSGKQREIGEDGPFLTEADALAKANERLAAIVDRLADNARTEAGNARAESEKQIAVAKAAEARLALLTGEGAEFRVKITIQSDAAPLPRNNAILAIKTLRDVTGLGLVEAKEMVDRGTYGAFTSALAEDLRERLNAQYESQARLSAPHWAGLTPFSVVPA